MPRVIVLGTGGTIQSLGRDELDVHEYVDFGRIASLEEILERAPVLSKLAEIVPVNFRTLPSSAVSIDDWLDLNRTIDELVRAHAPIDGVVVTHGTSTLEETAYFLHLALKTSATVAITGAHRPFNTVGSDALANLIASTRVVTAPQARDMGVLVVLGDEIHSAREVTKTASGHAPAFRTADLGMLGYVDSAGAVSLYRRPLRRHTTETPFDLRQRRDLPRVDIVYSYIGSDGCAIPTFVANGAKGIVSAGFPPDIPTRAERRYLEEARDAGVLIVQCSRAGSGKIARRKALRDAGFVVADNLTPQKARILAMLALCQTSDVEAVQEFFDAH